MMKIDKYPDSNILTVSSKDWYSQISGNSEPVFFEINSCIISYLIKNKTVIIVNGGRGEKRSFPLISVITQDGKHIDFRYSRQINLVENGIQAIFKTEGLTLKKEIKAYDNALVEGYKLLCDDSINISQLRYYFTTTRDAYDWILKNVNALFRIEINGQNILQLESLNCYQGTNQFYPVVFFEYLTNEKALTITYHLS